MGSAILTRRIYSGILAPDIVTNDLKFYVTTFDPNSYTGSNSTWTDISGNNNNGNLSGASFNSLENAFYFDGVGDELVVPTSNALGLNNTKQATMEIWAKLQKKSSSNAYQHVMGYRHSGDGFFFLILDRGSDPVNTEARFENSTGPYDIAVNFSPYFDNWTHIVFSLNTNGTKLYFNGNLVGTASFSDSGMNFGSVDYRIGEDSTGNYDMLGYVSVARFYDRQLSLSEIQQNYNSEKSRFGL